MLDRNDGDAQRPPTAPADRGDDEEGTTRPSAKQESLGPGGADGDVSLPIASDGGRGDRGAQGAEDGAGVGRRDSFWPMPVKWTRRLVVGLVIAALVVGFTGRHGGAVLTSFALALAALAVGLLSLPDGDPEVD
jgi:hypothetical protein